MRGRLVRSTVMVAILVMLVLATPVVLLIKRATEDELRSSLAAQASAISTTLSSLTGESGLPDPSRISGMVPDGDQIVIRDATGKITSSAGPIIKDGFHAVAEGPNKTQIELVSSGRDLRQRLTRQFILLGVLAAGGVLLAAVLAAIFGARLTRPLEQLAASAARLGAGDFSAALPPVSGIREIDDIRATLAMSANRLDKTLSSERSFTGDATHQLRTGLTGIALQLQLLATHEDEAVRVDASHALAQTDRLTATLDELLDLARGGRGSQRITVQLHEIALEHRGDWLNRFQLARRGLLCHGASVKVMATPGFVGQIIDILLDNALRHGRGDVRIELRERTLRISDEGTITERTAEGLFRGSDDPAAPHGRGLALARRLAQADGGRLELVARSPTTFVLTLPVAHQA